MGVLLPKLWVMAEMAGRTSDEQLQRHHSPYDLVRNMCTCFMDARLMGKSWIEEEV